MNTINNLKEFEEAIKDIKNKNNGNDFFFRGQANAEWDITSSAFRFLKDQYPTLDITSNILDEFEQEIPEFYALYSKQPEIDVQNNRTELLCMLQHLGGKTPIIDISSQPRIALFFACEQLIDDKDGVVFVFPTNSKSEILNASQEAIGILIGETKLNKDNPASRRYIAQDSHFFKPKNGCKIKNNDEILKIIIDKNAKHSILEELNGKGINHQEVYPDIFEFISRQAQYNKCENVFFSDIMRSIAQTIKDGNIIRTAAAIQTLDDLMSKNSWSEEKLIKMKYLKIEGLLCMQKYDEALNLLSLIPNDFYTLQSYHKTDACKSEDFDPTHIQFIPEFEKAKCYMGKKEYELAETCYAKASKMVHNIMDDNTRNDFWKSYAKSLVLLNKNNLIIAQDILLKHKKDGSISWEPDRAELYMLAEEWEKAIEILKNFVDHSEDNKDYAYTLLGNCYMALSQKGNKNLYIQQAIEYYKSAIPTEKRNVDNSYVQKTQYHDQYYKLAVAYQKLNNIEKAKEYYKIIKSYPFENEDAMHDLAYMLYKKNVNQTKEAMEEFFYAIEHSRAKKNPRNFNDLGRLLLDLYQGKRDFPNDSHDFMCLLKTSFTNLGKKIEFHEDVQVELRTVIDLISKEVSDKQLILSIAESCFKIAKLLNITDAFANKNLGDIYYEEFQSSIDPLTKNKIGLLALNSYNLANCFYSIDQQTDNVIKNRINELKKVLSIDYTIINGYE